MIDTEKRKISTQRFQQTEKYKEYQREYKKTSKYKEQQRQYRKNSLKKKATDKKYRGSEHFKEWRKEYLKRPNVKISNLLRCRLYQALRFNKKPVSAVRDLGISIEDFKVYLENLFTEGMTWENVGEWHIDHIIPLSSFDLLDVEQMKIACNYTNLQPLWAKDNLIKGKKLKYDNKI